jgi:hypothetical protein
MHYILWLLLGVASAPRPATVHEVQPTLRDATHAVWLHGPTHSGKVDASAAAAWPHFSSSMGTRSGARCATLDDARYTGYDEGGQYCEAASTALDDNAHLLVFSGRLGVALDAGGLKAAANSGSRNLFTKLGALSGAAATPSEAHGSLPSVTSSITLDVTCSGELTTYVLGAKDNGFVQVGLVRQGHTVTQLSLTGFEFQSATSGGVYGPCETFVSTQQSNADFTAAAGGRRLDATSSVTDGPNATDTLNIMNIDTSDLTDALNVMHMPKLTGVPTTFTSAPNVMDAPTFTLPPNATGTARRLTHNTNHHCNQDYGGASHPCPSAAYPKCVGFVQGSGWGKCWSECTASGGHPNLWGELSVWGDAINFELAWDGDFDLGAGCTGSVGVVIGSHRASLALPNSRRLTLALTAANDTALVAGQTSTHAIAVSSTATNSPQWILERAATQDVFVEVPTSTPKCSYNTACRDVPLKLVDVIATNPHPTESQTLRLSFSRNFETRGSGITQSSPSAEITGLTTQLWETASAQASGIPMQLSKNWHSGSNAAYWAGFDGSWWTASSLLRLPPNSTISLSLALSYEL